MDKKEFEARLMAVISAAIDERGELDDAACLEINPQTNDMNVVDYVVDAEGAEELDYYPLIDLTLMDVDGNMHADADIISELAEDYFKQ